MDLHAGVSFVLLNRNLFVSSQIDGICTGWCDSLVESCLGGAGASLQELLPHVQRKILAVAATEPLKLLKQVALNLLFYRKRISMYRYLVLEFLNNLWGLGSRNRVGVGISYRPTYAT
jgi:hypothetical protein